ncbi:MAG: ATP-binding protein [Lepagella sp.]
MKHLNKIIFLNSANIPYAEVMTDGNVHFAGTQGVGKSTLLRALLFFYNADKMKLGIQPGQRSFEEFYFRYSNSYIVYEVKRDMSAYTIFLQRSQGRIMYRFIDAPYRKEWMVDSDGRVESDWIRIREKIGPNVDISAKIDTYEMYRDIIFGNTHDRSHRYDKYALVESSKYQNIPRSIQNVFLNSKLDADFVKNTIIRSMSDVEDAIDLATYRHLVADFEREFDEIDCWYRSDAAGEVPVRNKAQRVIDSYRLLIALDFDLKQIWRQLNFVVTQTREQIPIAEDEIRNLHDRLARLKERIAAVEQEYLKEHDHNTAKLGELNLRLSDLRKKKKHYEELHIRDIIELDAMQPKYLDDLKTKEDLLETLQAQYRDVAEKYKALYGALDWELEKFELAQSRALQFLRENIQGEREALAKSRDGRRKSVDTSFAEWMLKSEERMLALQEDYNAADKSLAQLQFWHPKEQEMTLCREEIAELKSEYDRVSADLKLVEEKMNALRADTAQRTDMLNADFDRREESLRVRLDILKEEQQKTREMLDRYAGSLYEWLSANRPGWENNIGRVVDEQHVLYARGLAPELSADTPTSLPDSLYGVSLNLDAIEPHHRSPDDLKTLLKQQSEAVDEVKHELSDLANLRQKELDAQQRRFSKALSLLKQEEANINVRLMQIPQQIKDSETRLHQLQREEADLLEKEGEKRRERFNNALLDINKEREAIKQQRAKRDKDLKAADSAFNSALRELTKRLEEFKSRQKMEAAERAKEVETRRAELQRQEHDELKGHGADIGAIELCRKEIVSIQELIDRIASQHHFVIEYRKDDEELFSHEEEFREDKRRLEARELQAKQAYDLKRKRLESEQNDMSDLLHQRSATLTEMQEGLKQYDLLCGVESIIPEPFLNDEQKIASAYPCSELVVQMRGAINKRRQKQEDLKRYVNSFNSHFGANNTFHFISPQYDEDYMKFAVDLLDFVENDKIEDYRRRVSNHYNDILRSVAREVGLLMNHSAEIKGIINEVNRDFRERNFAGVIKSIELRAEESSDRMISLLRSIRDFTEEHNLSIGELNLFSGDDHDRVNDKVVDYLKRFMKQLQKEPLRRELTLSDTFRLQFRIKENDNNTGWVERINNVGSDGTDVLVKAMVNIMLINVFKTKAARKSGDFIIHCMMDEIGKLHPANVSGILQFANVRNIYLINSSPMGYNQDIYKYNYLLTKDGKSQTHVKRLVTINA